MLSRSNRAKFQSQRIVDPGDISNGSLYMHSFDLLWRASLRIESVHFTDGSVWKPSARFPGAEQVAAMDQARNERGGADDE
jgi:hypothetical protein